MPDAEPINVLHIISCPASGGAEVYVRDLALAASRLGHKVTILFLERAEEAGRKQDYQADFLRQLDDGGVKYEFIGARARHNPLFGWLRTRKLLRQSGATLVHAHLYYAIFFTAGCGLPVIYTHHNVRLRFRKSLYRLFFNRLVATYVGISSVCASALRAGGCRPVVQINNGVDPARIHRRGVKRPESIGQPLRMLAVGRLAKQKNYPLLLTSLAQVETERPWRLEIAGEGPERAELEALAFRLGIHERVDFVGSVTNVSERMAASDIFVMSSNTEGLPIALIEATLAGLPVVVTNVGGCSEVVHMACNGIVVDDMEEGVFAEALAKMLDDETLRASFARNASVYGGKYELSTSLAAHLRLYSSLARQ